MPGGQDRGALRLLPSQWFSCQFSLAWRYAIAQRTANARPVNTQVSMAAVPILQTPAKPQQQQPKHPEQDSLAAQQALVESKRQVNEEIRTAERERLPQKAEEKEKRRIDVEAKAARDHQEKHARTRALSPTEGRSQRSGVANKRYNSTIMTKLESVEREVEQLAPEELAAFRAWFIEHDWQAWDRELEQDVAAGRLDQFADEALAEYERGETTEL